jgi:hypothetical protein
MKKQIFILAALVFTSAIYSDWQRINSFGQILVYDIYIPGSTIYVATGSNGIYKSTDATASWQPISNGLNNGQAIQCRQVILFAGNLYTATVDGIYKSTNLGGDWVKKSNGIVVGPGAIYEFCESIYELNGTLFTGAYSGIYRSTNGGESWIATNITGMHVFAKNFTMHNGTVFAARETNNIPVGYTSTDNGLTWGALTSLTFPTITFLSEPGKLFAGTIDGAWLSTNNGASWMHRIQGLTPDPYNSAFVRVNGILVSSLKFGGSGMFKTSNDGVLWENFGQGLSFLSTINDLIIFNNKILTATSAGIFERNTAEVTGVTQISNEVPMDYSLNQNYPNPFNPVTQIVYSIPKSSNVKVMIYDAIGGEVSVPVNQNQQAGTYQISFDASALSSGIYYYRIYAGEFTQTRKMILVK